MESKLSPQLSLSPLPGSLTHSGRGPLLQYCCYLGGDDYLIFRTRQASATTLAFSLICPSSVTSRSWFEISLIDINDLISITNIITINDIVTFMHCCFHQRLTITKVGPDKELVCAVRAVLAARRFLINISLRQLFCFFPAVRWTYLKFSLPPKGTNPPSYRCDAWVKLTIK